MGFVVVEVDGAIGESGVLGLSRDGHACAVLCLARGATRLLQRLHRAGGRCASRCRCVLAIVYCVIIDCHVLLLPCTCDTSVYDRILVLARRYFVAVLTSTSPARVSSAASRWRHLAQTHPPGPFRGPRPSNWI